MNVDSIHAVLLKPNKLLEKHDNKGFHAKKIEKWGETSCCQLETVPITNLLASRIIILGIFEQMHVLLAATVVTFVL